MYFTFFLFLLFIECVVNLRRDSTMSLKQIQSSFYEVVGNFARNTCNIGYEVYHSLCLLFVFPVILVQGKVYFRIAEIPIHFRTIEMITVLFKDDTLHFLRVAFVLETDINILLFQMSKKVFPFPAPSNLCFQRLLNFILGLIRLFQAILFDFLLATGKVQTIFGGQFLANLLTSESVVTVRNGLSIIIYAIESDMNVWMFLVEMAADGVLSIFYSHLIHILTSHFHHPLIAEFARVLCGETQGEICLLYGLLVLMETSGIFLCTDSREMEQVVLVCPKHKLAPRKSIMQSISHCYGLIPLDFLITAFYKCLNSAHKHSSKSL